MQAPSTLTWQGPPVGADPVRSGRRVLRHRGCAALATRAAGEPRRRRAGPTPARGRPEPPTIERERTTSKIAGQMRGQAKKSPSTRRLGEGGGAGAKRSVTSVRHQQACHGPARHSGPAAPTSASAGGRGGGRYVRAQSESASQLTEIRIPPDRSTEENPSQRPLPGEIAQPRPGKCNQTDNRQPAQADEQDRTDHAAPQPRRMVAAERVGSPRRTSPRPRNGQPTRRRG